MRLTATSYPGLDSLVTPYEGRAVDRLGMDCAQVGPATRPQVEPYPSAAYGAYAAHDADRAGRTPTPLQHRPVLRLA